VRENLKKLAGGTVHCAPFVPAEGHSGHVARWFLGSVGLSAALASTGMLISLRRSEKQRAEELWHSHGLVGKAVLAVHRGAGNRAKRWTQGGYEDVTRWWRSRGGAVLEVAGPEDQGEPLAPSHSLVQGLALGDLAGLLARADLYLGSDTGVSHLAGAVGARGVVVFGPTRPLAWRPLGGRLVCLKGVVPGSGNEPVSLSSVSSARVIRALDLLASAQAQP
jgi:ADP-heptose:LPS heptosyltransferase